MIRKEIKKEFDLGFSDLEGDISKVAEGLLGKDAYYKSQGYHRVEICIESMFEDTNIYILAYRWETDAEYDKRIIKEKKDKEARKLKKQKELINLQERQKKLLAELKEKYPND